MRLSIERYLFELLALLKNMNFSAEEERKCRSINGIFALMQETDPEYRKTVEFTRIVASVIPNSPEITIVDTAYLRRKWEELSNYCHKQLAPEESFASPNREFQERGFKLLDEILARFKDWKWESVCGIIHKDSMPDEVKEVYDKFVREEITSEETRRMLQIMEPVLSNRLRMAR
jgi:hypothetical protein